VRYDRDRQIRAAQRFKLRTSQCHERSRANDERGDTLFRGFYTVVDTPRRARTSIAGSCNDKVASLRDIR
jgi:hypothetical protein